MVIGPFQNLHSCTIVFYCPSRPPDFLPSLFITLFFSVVFHTIMEGSWCGVFALQGVSRIGSHRGRRFDLLLCFSSKISRCITRSGQTWWLSSLRLQRFFLFFTPTFLMSYSLSGRETVWIPTSVFRVTPVVGSRDARCRIT